MGDRPVDIEILKELTSNNNFIELVKDIDKQKYDTKISYSNDTRSHTIIAEPKSSNMRGIEQTLCNIRDWKNIDAAVKTATDNWENMTENENFNKAQMNTEQNKIKKIVQDFNNKIFTKTI